MGRFFIPIVWPRRPAPTMATRTYPTRRDATSVTGPDDDAPATARQVWGLFVIQMAERVKREGTVSDAQDPKFS